MEGFEAALEDLDAHTSREHPLIAKAQRDGVVSIIGELRAQMEEFAGREINGSLSKRDNPLTFLRRFKNVAQTPDREMRPSTFVMVAVEHGILVNGDYGTNPSREEMREMLDAMRALVEYWDKNYGNTHGQGDRNRGMGC